MNIFQGTKWCPVFTAFPLLSCHHLAQHIGLDNDLLALFRKTKGRRLVGLKPEMMKECLPYFHQIIVLWNGILLDHCHHSNLPSPTFATMRFDQSPPPSHPFHDTSSPFTSSSNQSAQYSTILVFAVEHLLFVERAKEGPRVGVLVTAVAG